MQEIFSTKTFICITRDNFFQLQEIFGTKTTFICVVGDRGRDVHETGSCVAKESIIDIWSDDVSSTHEDSDFLRGTVFFTD